jgi:hypothetical protein
MALGWVKKTSNAFSFVLMGFDRVIVACAAFGVCRHVE